MKISRTRLKEIIKGVMTEENEYQAFFQKALDKAGKSIPSMSEEEKKAFFDKIDSAWNGKGEKNEELVGGQKKLDVDKDGDIGSDDLADLRAGKKANESVNEDYDGPAVLKTGDKNALKVGEKITINSGGKKKEYKVVKSNGNGDFVLHLVESVNFYSGPLKLKDIKINKKSPVTFVLEVSFLIGDEVVMSYLTTGTSQDAQKLKSKVEKAFNAGKIVSPSGIGYYAYNESVKKK
jgi:hypothetical protein